jgi:hypothetical protein
MPETGLPPVDLRRMAALVRPFGHAAYRREMRNAAPNPGHEEDMKKKKEVKGHR